MPTNQNGYNTRLTDEALEKRFRDTFRSQGGAELVDDLYASGVIVPVVDFTQAAEGSQLPELLQTAWDFGGGYAQVASNTPVNVITTSGFWKVDLSCAILTSAASITNSYVSIYDGSTDQFVWAASSSASGAANDFATVLENQFVVFLRAGDVLRAKSISSAYPMDIWYRQIADVSGNLTNPSGFTSS